MTENHFELKANTIYKWMSELFDIHKRILENHENSYLKSYHDIFPCLSWRRPVFDNVCLL